MPQGDAVCRDEFIIRHGHPMNWTEIIPSLSSQDSSLQDAFSALSISRVGQGHKDARLVHESAILYGKALKELQTALFDPSRMHSDQVLMACMLLGLYEVFEGPAFNSRSWMAHATGAARLIQLRGPHRHQNWDAHHPFLASRIPTIYAAILQRKTTYLAAEEWLTVPWEFQLRTYMDRLVDLGTLVPGILERFDTLRESDSNTAADLLQLLEECKDLQERMNRWKDATKKGAVPRVVKHDAGDPDGYPFETDLWFENHLFVHARLVYYTCSLVLAEAAHGIQQALNLRDHKTSELDQSSWLTDLFPTERHAANICRIVPYCLQPEMGALGANIINFPANLAIAYYRRIGHIAATTWLVKAFSNIKIRGLHVDNVFNEILPSARGRDDAVDYFKSESNMDSPETGTSPCSSLSCTSQSLVSSAATFVYEDPSKEYYDASDDPG